MRKIRRQQFLDFVKCSGQNEGARMKVDVRDVFSSTQSEAASSALIEEYSSLPLVRRPLTLAYVVQLKWRQVI
jgi:hypothetical protein